MRTTIDMPDALYRKTKAIAALRGASMKDVIIRAVEREVTTKPAANVGKRRSQLPLIKSSNGRKIDLTNFDFDELLG
jgi:hypothetical protein